MNQFVDFFRKLLDTSDFPPRWHCGKWSDFHGWFYIISDLMIWSAYFAIPVIIINYLSRRKDIRFHKIYFLFATFILACGLTHLVDAIMFWYPAYRINALIRFITAVASWLTVYHLFKILPAAFALRSPGELENEIIQRKLVEEELIKMNRQLNEAQDIARLGHWEWDVTTGSLYWSKGMYKIFGLDDAIPMTYDLFLSQVHPEDREHVNHLVSKTLITKEFPEYYHRIIQTNGDVTTIHARGELVLDQGGNVVKMLGTGQDVTELKRTEEALLSKTRELQEVNNELEKFAYVASHDLQEPLRKMITYAALLEDYNHLLDDRGRIFLSKISVSSLRMKKLITDILNLSKFSSGDIVFENIDLNELVRHTISDLEMAINETKAKIIIGDLPEIEANPVQMHQLFLNIISNGLKFKKDKVVPFIKVDCTIVQGNQLPEEYAVRHHHRFQLIGTQKLLEQENFCKITIADNGIGFNPLYLARIFEVFQRLHGKNDYEGTGIGLAICKKIIENHDGFITASSREGEGAVFTIFLPLSQKHFRRTIKAVTIQNASEANR